MTVKISIKRHDTGPQISLTLWAKKGVPLDLTTATSVVFNIAESTTRTPLVLRRSTVSSGAELATGIVKMNWLAADTANSGTFFGEVEITWPGGVVQTVPGTIGQNFIILITDDLG